VTRKNLKITACGTGLLVLALAVAACGSTNGSKGGAHPVAAASGGSGALVSQAGTGARLSGTYSSEDFWNWVPNNLFPSSLTQVPGGEYKSEVVTPDDKYDLSSISCTSLLQNAGGPGFGEEAYMIDQGQNASGSQLYSYAVYEFATPAQASAMVSATATKFAACGTFSVSQQGGTSVPVTLAQGAASETNVPAADEVADLRQSATINGKSLVSDMVYAADGNVVLVESGTSTTGSLPNAVNLDTVAQATLAAFAAGQAKAVADHQPSDYTTTTAEPSLPAGDRIGGAR
jgi:hypothetical protein